MISNVNPPSSLFTLSLNVLSNHLLCEWEQSYLDHEVFSNNLKSQIMGKVPTSIYNQLFHHMIETHALDDNHPRMHLLIRSLLTENLLSLDLKCISYVTKVRIPEWYSLHHLLIRKIPNMTNLTKISFQRGPKNSIMSIGSDSMMMKIGSSCQNLRTLDISYNNITDLGLQYLVPNDGRGCPLLSKVDLFGCKVTVEGVAAFIVGLPNLKFLGYRETGQCLKTIYRQNFGEAKVQLKLIHVNNVGSNTKESVDLHDFECNSELVNAVSNLCPRVKGLKIPVRDSSLRHLSTIDTVSILNLIYTERSSPGNEFMDYIINNGSRLKRLYIECNWFTTAQLKIVGEYCSNLNIFELKCNKFLCEEILKLCDKNKCSLLHLEILNLHIVGSEHIEIPYSVINYILHKSNCLKEIVLDMYNRSLNDSYIENLLSSINTAMINKIMIKGPYEGDYVQRNDLSMASVVTIISKCPQLAQLGNLSFWDINCYEVEEMRILLKRSNSALNLLSGMKLINP